MGCLWILQNPPELQDKEEVLRAQLCGQAGDQAGGAWHTTPGVWGEAAKTGDDQVVDGRVAGEQKLYFMWEYLLVLFLILFMIFPPALDAMTVAENYAREKSKERKSSLWGLFSLSSGCED